MKPTYLYSAISKETFEQGVREGFLSSDMFRGKEFWATISLPKAKSHHKLKKESHLVTINVSGLDINQNHNKMKTDWIIEDCVNFNRITELKK